MTKDEMIAKLKAKRLQESNVTNVNKAEDTIGNIDTKVVTSANKGEGIQGLSSELPTQKEIEKIVNGADGPFVDADKEGVSKNGGDYNNLMSAGGVEAERKKQDSAMKDMINVSTRKVEEAAEVEKELLAQLEEAAAKETRLKARLSEIIELSEQALAAQKEELTDTHAKRVEKLFEALVIEGEKLEVELTESSDLHKSLYKKASASYKNSTKLNKILLEAVKSAQPEKKLTRYMTPSKRAIASLSE